MGVHVSRCPGDANTSTSSDQDDGSGPSPAGSSGAAPVRDRRTAASATTEESATRSPSSTSSLPSSAGSAVGARATTSSAPSLASGATPRWSRALRSASNSDATAPPRPGGRLPGRRARRGLPALPDSVGGRSSGSPDRRCGHPMTVLMTVDRAHPLAGPRGRGEWQQALPDDVPSASVALASDAVLQHPHDPVEGIRPQPFTTHAWLLDLAALPAGWQHLELVVDSRQAHPVSVALEVRGGSGRQVLQHPGLVTVPGARQPLVRIVPEEGGWWAMALADPGGADLPVPLREAAALARQEGLVRAGEPVTAVVDVSGSMRPRLEAGTVGCVLTALQAVAGAAGAGDLPVVAVSDVAHGPRPLPVDADAEQFLRSWVREIGLRTGSPNGAGRPPARAPPPRPRASGAHPPAPPPPPRPPP